MGFVVVALFAYLIGSIPFGFLIGKARGVDLRTTGSGNIGATNALRTLGKTWGYLCFFLDFAKGFLAVFLARTWLAAALGVDPVAAGVIAAVCVVLGHNFPIWLGFKGGKGISTSGGVILGLFHPIVFVVTLVVWLLLFITTRYVSVASMGGALALSISLGVLWTVGMQPLANFVLGVVLTALAIWRHRSNIVRLAQGTESKFKKKSAADV